MFARKGFSATSIREIACQAKVNLAMINYYFKSKENLLESMMQSSIESVIKELKHIMQEDKSELEKLDAIIDVHAQYIFGNRDIAAILFQEQMLCSYPRTRIMLQELGALNRKNFEQLIASGQKRRLFSKTVNPHLLYASLAGTIQQVVVMATLQDTGQPEESSSVPELTAYLKFMCHKLLLA